MRRSDISQDTLWSALEDRQLIGRCWRQPQKKTVIVYRLIAMDTADSIISDIAFSKWKMHDAFVNPSGPVRKLRKSRCVENQGLVSDEPVAT